RSARRSRRGQRSKLTRIRRTREGVPRSSAACLHEDVMEENGKKSAVAITSAMVKDLRERTQAGMADCKNALVEASGDMEKAVEVILKKGLVKAAAPAGRVAPGGG